MHLSPMVLEEHCDCSDKINPMDEPALIRDAQHGDLDAFNRLVLAYQDALYNTALRILGDEDLAADATQEAFISAFRAINSYRGGSFKAWLLRTVTNACYDELRRKKRRPTTPLEPETDDGEEVESPRWLADPSASPKNNLSQTNSNTPSSTAWTTCPPISAPWSSWPTSRAWTTPKWRSAAHVPLGTIKSRLARARLRLRECLQGFGELLPAAFRLEEERGAS